MKKSDIVISDPVRSAADQVAATFFDSVRPSILMIGPWDDYFSMIKKQYKWASHTFSPPGRYQNHIALIVINNRDYFGQVVNALNITKLNASILVYDDNDLVPKNIRLTSNNLVCYLRSSAPRYINGHIRTMLQLQRCFYDVIDDFPLIVTDPILLNSLLEIEETLDKGFPLNVVFYNAYYFFLLFKTIVKNPHYKSVQYIDSIKKFDDLATHEHTTLLLKVSSVEEYLEYKSKPIMEFTTVFISDFNLKEKQGIESYDLREQEKSKSAFYLSAYYYALEQNLNDDNNRTRFIQMGDLEKIFDDSGDFFQFYETLQHHHKTDSIKFKNMAPMIRGVSYGLMSLNVLVDFLVSTIYEEFFEQSDFILEHAEMVSGVKRSTLQSKLEKLKK